MTKVERSTVYVIALPIGNPMDITKRAIHILENVDLIAAEDTRVLKTLLSELNIKTKARIFSYHEHNEQESSKELIKLIKNGSSLALTSDAGTPRLSDPGYDLIHKCFEESISVFSIPGPSSLTAALSVSPIGGNTHFFGGFLPSQSKQRKESLKENSSKADKIVYFESPHRLVEHLEDALNVLGDIELSIHRELTKTHEESEFNKTSYFIKKYSDKSPKGEFVLIYTKSKNSQYSLEDLKIEIKKQLKQNKKDTEISAGLATKSDLSKKEIYKIIQELKK